MSRTQDTTPLSKLEPDQYIDRCTAEAYFMWAASEDEI